MASMCTKLPDATPRADSAFLIACIGVSTNSLERSWEIYSVSIGVEVRSHGLDLVCVLHWLVHYSDHSDVSHVVVRVDLVCKPS